MEGENKDKYLLSSINNALKVLDFLGVRDSASMTEICRGCKLNKTVVFKILYTLERKGYVFKTASAKYKLGVKFMNYGERVAERQDLFEVAVPYMRKLRDEHQLPTYLGTLNPNGKVIVVHKERPANFEDADVRIGFEMEAHTNSLGKVLLAHLQPAMLHTMMEQIHFRPRTPHTIVTAAALYDALKGIKADGYCLEIGEHYIGHSSTSAPVFNSSKQCVAGLGIVYPTDASINEKELIESVISKASEISERLGYENKGLS